VPRFSIARLMALVALIALAFTAMRSGSELWSDAMLTATLASVMTAALGAVCCRGTTRAAWAGFAVFGSGYLTLSFGPWFQAEIRPHLVTTHLLDYLHPRIAPVPPPGASLGSDGRWYLYLAGPKRNPTVWGNDTSKPFQRSVVTDVQQKRSPEGTRADRPAYQLRRSDGPSPVRPWGGPSQIAASRPCNASSIATFYKRRLRAAP
jgi:hypothetical protein